MEMFNLNLIVNYGEAFDEEVMLYSAVFRLTILKRIISVLNDISNWHRYKL